MEEPGPCGLHASCINIPGSYSCACLRGYLMGSGGCQGSSACRNVCVCVVVVERMLKAKFCYLFLLCRSYVSPLSFTDFVDIDECALAAVTSLQACQAGEDCINTSGSFTCSCPTGYEKALTGKGCLGKTDLHDHDINDVHSKILKYFILCFLFIILMEMWHRYIP